MPNASSSFPEIIVEDYEGDAARDLGRRDHRRPSFSAGCGPCRVSASRRPRFSWLCWASSSDVRPPGWQEVSRPFGDPGTTFSVADITDAGVAGPSPRPQGPDQGGRQGSQGRHRQLAKAGTAS